MKVAEVSLEVVLILIKVVYDYAAILITLFILLGTVFLAHYYYNIARLPMVTCGSTEFKTFLKRSMPVLSEKYWPTIWCYESRMQSCLAYFLCPGFNVQYDREILTLDDGGEIALDWTHVDEENAPIIIILPGITGSSQEGYVKRFVANTRDHHFRCVVLNLRGLATNLELKTPKLSCVTDTTDTRRVVEHIQKRFPGAAVGACGISLGALILANYLIQHPHSQDISVAMLNCTPFDVFVAANKSESGFEIIFNAVITWRLLQVVKRFRRVFETCTDKRWDLEKVMNSKTIREFDDRFIGKMFGYESVLDYYADATLVDKMHKIKIPVLCLNAADDMFQPLEYSEDDTCGPLYDSDKVAFVITSTGGHIGHLEGWLPFWKKTTYQLRVFNQFFSAMFQNDSFKQFLPAQTTCREETVRV